MGGGGGGVGGCGNFGPSGPSIEILLWRNLFFKMIGPPPLGMAPHGFVPANLMGKGPGKEGRGGGWGWGRSCTAQLRGGEKRQRNT